MEIKGATKNLYLEVPLRGSVEGENSKTINTKSEETAMQIIKIPDEIWSLPLKNRGCTCNPLAPPVEVVELPLRDNVEGENSKTINLFTKS